MLDCVSPGGVFGRFFWIWTPAQTSVGIGIVGEVPLTKTAPAVLVRNIIWDRTVGSYTHLHAQAHIPSSGIYAGMISIGASSLWSSTCSRVLFVSLLTLLHGLISMNQSPGKQCITSITLSAVIENRAVWFRIILSYNNGIDFYGCTWSEIILTSRHF